MHQLLLLRHAKSSRDDPNLPDRERPLTKRGRHAARLMRQAIGDLGLAPDLVLVSTARRTMQTLEALEPWDETPLIEPLDALYLAEADRLFATLQEVTETVRSVLLIGHNPGLHELALALRDSTTPADDAARRLADGFPTGALAEFTVGVPWVRLDPGRGRLSRFLTPRELERTA